MTTFSQSVAALVRYFHGRTFNSSSLTSAARSYLRRTGTPQPSREMIDALADEVYRVLMDEKRDMLRNRCDDSAINAGTISQSPVGSDDFCHPTGHENRATKRNS